MSLIAWKLFLLILIFTRQGLICLFSFISLIFVSHARKRFKEGIIKEIIDNILALAFVTYLFTFFNILITYKFMSIATLTSEFILNIFIVLIIVVIIKTAIDIIKFSKKQEVKRLLSVPKKAKRKSKSSKIKKLFSNQFN